MAEVLQEEDLNVIYALVIIGIDSEDLEKVNEHIDGMNTGIQAAISFSWKVGTDVENCNDTIKSLFKAMQVINDHLHFKLLRLF